MRRMHMSISGLSTLLAMGLALWEIYFFFYSEGTLQTQVTNELLIFTPDRLGFNLAWLTFIYLSYQLISIPFALPTAGHRFMGVVDGMASLVPLVVVLIVLFGKPQLLVAPGRWEAAILLACVSAADLFGGYAFTIALSRRVFDVTGAASS
jgi:hypothetical protein